MNGYFKTDKGQVRNHNEDDGGFFRNQAGQFLAVIADGMGGHRAGDVASRMATSQLGEKWEKASLFSQPEKAEEWLRKVIEEINAKIFTHAKEHLECQGMGTTVVAVICTEEFITVAHIGDSRCYLENGRGFRQVTEDHSLVNELVRSGQISKEEAENHPRKNVLLKALGTETEIQSEVRSIGWEAGNKLLLCSDGLTNKLTDLELSNFVENIQEPRKTAENMVDLANERGGEDNISLVLIHHSQDEEEVVS